jgi:hypothetical protein
VKFIYFGISYDNPCSLLPAPRSPLQAHVLATSETALAAKKVLEANPQAGWAKINDAHVEARKKFTKAKRDAMNTWLPICNLEFAEIICTVTKFKQSKHGKTKLTKNNISVTVCYEISSQLSQHRIEYFPTMLQILL